MSASYSALQLGLLLWKIKMCQDSVWSEDARKIIEIDDALGELDVVLPSVADKISRTFEKRLERVLARIEKRHRFVADQNVEHFLSLVDTEKNTTNRHAAYHEYLVDKSNVRFREWQKEDRRSLRELLATLLAADKRLQGYFEIGSRFGEAVDESHQAVGPMTKKERGYVLAGMKKLPLREQREIEPFFMPMSLDLFLFGKRIEKLGRFLRSHEDDLVAKPKWDGKVMAYRGKPEEIKIQENSVIGIILGEAEKQEWADSIKIPKRISIRETGQIKEVVIHQKSITNALSHFHRQHNIMEFSVNGDRLIWGPPGTVKEKAKGIAKIKKGR